jgi:hypothetical protein
MSTPPPVNPNVANAKRRSGARPKTQNTPSVSAPQTLRWVEPLAEPVSIDMAFEQNFVEEYSGYFDLEFAMPNSISSPYTDHLRSMMYRTEPEIDRAEEILPAFRSMFHMKAAQKLFATLPQSEQSELQPLKGVYYDDTEIPRSAIPLVNSIGYRI